MDKKEDEKGAIMEHEGNGINNGGLNGQAPPEKGAAVSTDPFVSDAVGIGIGGDMSGDMELSERPNPLPMKRSAKGRFLPGGPGGPGRPRKLDRAEAGEGTVEGEGDDELTDDMLSSLLAAIRRKGPKFWDNLLERSPVVGAQLLSCLTKLAPENRGGTVQPITVVVNPGFEADDSMRGTDPITEAPPEAPYVKLMAEGSAQPARCPICWRLLAIERMIEPYGNCICGQQWRDAVEGVETPCPEDTPSFTPGGSNAFCVGGPAKGRWKQHASLDDALAAHRD